MPRPPTPVTDETVRALSTELVRLTRRRDASSALVLDASAFKILWLVVEEGPHTLRALADGLQLDQSTLGKNERIEQIARTELYMTPLSPARRARRERGISSGTDRPRPWRRSSGPRARSRERASR